MLTDVIGALSYFGLSKQYYDCTWKELLQGVLMRVEKNIEALKLNPYYYFDITQKQGMLFFKHKDNYFINTGNNRTVIAKYFFHYNNMEPILKNVYVTEYITRRKNLRDLAVKLKLYRKI